MARARGGGAAGGGRRCSAACCSSTPRARAKGSTWLRRAAAAGEAPAFWLLGAAHLRGLGVAVDAAQARVLVAAAAEAGVVEAQLELARMFDGGVGGARDEAAAARWERRRRRRAAPRLLARGRARGGRPGGRIALAIAVARARGERGQRARPPRAWPSST